MSVSVAEVRERALALARMISQSEEVERYRKAKEKIEQNREIQELLQALKRKQMRLSVLKMHGSGPPEMIDELQRSIDELEERLAAIPVVGQYRAAQEELNELLQGVARIIAHTVSSRIPVEVSTGGCSGGGCGSGCGGCNNR